MKYAAGTKALAAHAPVAQTPAAHATRAADTAKVKPALARKAAPRPRGPARPYFIYDSVTPTAIPAGKQVATYSNGMYKASSSAAARCCGSTPTAAPPGANVLDVEPGDATPAGAAHWVKARLNAHKDQLAVVYTYRSAWQAVTTNMVRLPSWMQTKIRYSIADPTGVNHVVTGSNATQWYWGKSYDITTANPGFGAQ